MDFDHLDDLDLDLPDLGEVGLPPWSELEPGPERQPPSVPVAVDPEVPLLTPVMVGVIVTFGLLYVAIMQSGGQGGPGLAWLLGGTFAALYVGVLWAGALFIGRHRR